MTPESEQNPKTETDRQLAELLFESRLVTRNQIREGIQRQMTIRRYSGVHVPLGEVLYLLGFVSMGEVQLMRKELPDPSSVPPAPDIPPIGEVLLQIRALDAKALDEALILQARLGEKGRHQLLGQLLVDQGVISEDDLQAALHILSLRRSERPTEGAELSGTWQRRQDGEGAGTWVYQSPTQDQPPPPVPVTGYGATPWWSTYEEEAGSESGPITSGLSDEAPPSDRSDANGSDETPVTGIYGGVPWWKLQEADTEEEEI